MDYETFQKQTSFDGRIRKALLMLFVVVIVPSAVIWFLGDESPASSHASESVPSVIYSDPLLKQIVDACPGLRKYKTDWTLVQSDHDQGKVEILMGSPLKEMPASYFATGHHCYFEVGGDRPDRVAVWKRPCVSACLDKQSTVPTSTLIDIK